MIARTGELSAIERFVAASADRPAVLVLAYYGRTYAEGKKITGRTA